MLSECLMLLYAVNVKHTHILPAFVHVQKTKLVTLKLAPSSKCLWPYVVSCSLSKRSLCRNLYDFKMTHLNAASNVALYVCVCALLCVCFVYEQLCREAFAKGRNHCGTILVFVFNHAVPVCLRSTVSPETLLICRCAALVIVFISKAFLN